jgi:hypothetical protein
MDHSDQNRKRLTIRRRDGRIVYCASAWPGWGAVAITLVAFIIIAAVLAGLIAFLHKLNASFDEVSQHSKWLGGILRFVFLGFLDLSFFATFALLLLWLPYFLIYQLSPKEFWLDGENLCHTVRLLGLLRHTRRIPFERIMEIEIAPSGSAFHLKAVYKMKLPGFVHFILTYWNEKLTTWPLALVTAIPTRQEAEEVQFELLEAMTKSAPARSGQSGEPG